MQQPPTVAFRPDVFPLRLCVRFFVLVCLFRRFIGDSGFSGTPFTALLLRVEINSVSPTRHSLHSLKELCIVLRGRLTCHIGKNEYPLTVGEGIFFDLITPHFWLNMGDEVAEVLFTGPNSFHLFEQVENDVRWHVSWKRQKRRTKAVRKVAQVQGRTSDQ